MLANLKPGQIEALKKIRNGCIVCGGTGSGKSRTALAYYYILNGGDLDGKKMQDPIDLYVITTAQKRDLKEWEGEAIPFLIGTELYSAKMVIDSWNNIQKYQDVTGAFFIFDEDRVTGKGPWVKAFLKLAKTNKWIILSATPGDNWENYIPVFIANGFYKNRYEFVRRHIVYKNFVRFPQIDRYLEEGKLNALRRRLLVDIPVERDTVQHHETIMVGYDKLKYREVVRDRWNPFTDKPIKNASEYCYTLRRIINSEESRQLALLELLDNVKRAIIFYNFDYELEILKEVCNATFRDVAEWNGHSHQPIPESEQWCYLVQYTAGCEGWNCTSTDTIIFWSQNYSYKVMVQAAGRIDRLNTPYRDLYYYHLKCSAGIDLAIGRALEKKKKFNERSFYGQ